MQNKRKTSALLICLVFLTSQAYCFEIGDINVHSNLSQPLDADIELASIDKDEISTLEVTLASKKQFKKMGLPYIKALSMLQFNIIKYREKNYIQITSPSAIREPLLDIVIRLKWKNGQRLQSYTLLFSPQ